MLNAKNFGLACGIIWGIAVLFIGLMSAYTNWGLEMQSVIASIYIGYEPTIAGSIIGGAWGFVDGFIGGYIFIWLYNKLNSSR